MNTLQKITAPFLAFALLFNVLSVTLTSAAAAQPVGGQILFILDASSSMLAKDGGSTTRIDKAKQALKQTMANVPEGTQAGLRVYGATVPDNDKQNGCVDTQLAVAPAANNTAKINAALDNIEAKGWTLMGKALQESQNDFKGEGPKTIVLLSDGIDTCSPPDACEVAKSLAVNGTQVKVNTLGLLVDNAAKNQLTCISGASGGQYYDVNSTDKLAAALAEITAKEVELFQTQGIPIDGNLRMDSAPEMLPDTLYKDELTVPQTLYYGIPVVEHRKVTVTIKGVDTGDQLSRLDYLQLRAYDAKTGETFNTITGDSERFATGPDVSTVSYEYDTDESGLTEGDVVAIGVSMRSGLEDGAVVPLEINYTSERNANAPTEEEEAAAAATETTDEGSMSPLMIVLLTLLSVALLAGAAFAGYKFYQKRKAASATTSNDDPTQGPPTTPTFG